MPTDHFMAICPQSRGSGTCAEVAFRGGQQPTACLLCGGRGFVLPSGCQGRIDPEHGLVHDQTPGGTCALHDLPRAHSWSGSEAMEFACPLPAWRMVADPDDPDADPRPTLEACGYPLTYEITDGGTFWGDLQPYEVGAQWQLGCQGGHVLVMADGVDDVPSSELAYRPEVALSALYFIGVRTDG